MLKATESISAFTFMPLSKMGRGWDSRKVAALMSNHVSFMRTEPYLIRIAILILLEPWYVDSLAFGSLRGRIAIFNISHVARLISIQKGCSNYSVRVALPPPSPDHESGRSPASRASECKFSQ